MHNLLLFQSAEVVSITIDKPDSIECDNMPHSNPDFYLDNSALVE